MLWSSEKTTVKGVVSLRNQTFIYYFGNTVVDRCFTDKNLVEEESFSRNEVETCLAITPYMSSK